MGCLIVQETSRKEVLLNHKTNLKKYQIESRIKGWAFEYLDAQKMECMSLTYTLKFQNNGRNGRHNIRGEYSKESSEAEE